MDQIRERVKSERGRPDKRERKSQIREGEKEIAWVAWPGSRNPGARPGFISSSSFFFFFFLLLALISFLAGAVLLYMSFKSSL